MTKEQHWLCIDINESTPTEELEKIQSLLTEKQGEIKQTLFRRKETIAKEWEAKSDYFKEAITNVMTRTLDSNLEILENSYLTYQDVKHWIDWYVKKLDKLAEMLPLGRLQDGIHEDSAKRSKLKIRKELEGFFYISYHHCGNDALIQRTVKQSAFQRAGLCTQSVLDEVNLLIEKEKNETH